MKVLVTGAGGLLGSEWVRLGERGGERSPASVLEIVGLTHSDLDVTDEDAVRERIAEEAPDWVVHCAAYTAVDRAEEEAEEAMRVNHGGTVDVAAGAAGADARLVYYSTDYVFDGKKHTPYEPDDPTDPKSSYARSKLAGEEAALGAGGLVVRTGWLYGSGGRNFVDAILERAERGESLRVVDDQWGRPTWARNVAETTLDLLRHDADGGIWHVADRGEASWLELAKEAIRLSGLEASVDGVSSEEWGAAAPRPEYSVLDVTRTEELLGRPMMPWREALRSYLETR